MSAKEKALFGPPKPHVLEIRNLIRLHLGIGGAMFPGADELYEAARKIEEWDAA
jgi:hypothetical protein